MFDNNLLTSYFDSKHWALEKNKQKVCGCVSIAQCAKAEGSNDDPKVTTKLVIKFRRNLNKFPSYKAPITTPSYTLDQIKITNEYPFLFFVFLRD